MHSLRNWLLSPMSQQSAPPTCYGSCRAPVCVRRLVVAVGHIVPQRSQRVHQPQRGGGLRPLGHTVHGPADLAGGEGERGVTGGQLSLRCVAGRLWLSCSRCTLWGALAHAHERNLWAVGGRRRRLATLPNRRRLALVTSCGCRCAVTTFLGPRRSCIVEASPRCWGDWSAAAPPAAPSAAQTTAGRLRTAKGVAHLRSERGHKKAQA